MKKLSLLLLGSLIFVFMGCKSMMSSSDSGENLYGKTWQLEYITGPRIAFDGLYPDKKPMITFNEEKMMVSGNNSCNGYSAGFIKAGNDGITFSDPGISTMMYCGEGEKVFLRTMKKINKYSIDKDGKLVLSMNDVPMMRFQKVSP